MNKRRIVSKDRIAKPRVPIDFGAEITDAEFDLDPSLVQSQAGQYFVKNIGLFGEADPTEKVGSVIEQQTADAGTALTVSDEHPASANVPVPPSHQKEGRPKVLRRIMKGGMVPSEESSFTPVGSNTIQSLRARAQALDQAAANLAMLAEVAEQTRPAAAAAAAPAQQQPSLAAAIGDLLFAPPPPPPPRPPRRIRPIRPIAQRTRSTQTEGER